MMRFLIIIFLLATFFSSYSQNTESCKAAHCFDKEGVLKEDLQFQPTSIKWPLHHSHKVVTDEKWILVRYQHHDVIETVSLAEYRNRTGDFSLCEDGIPMNEPFKCEIKHTGKPVYKETTCSLTGISHEEVLIPLGNGECSKKIIKWSIIDWCLYDSKTDDGKSKDDLFIVKDLVNDEVYYSFNNDYGKLKRDGSYHYEQVIEVGDAVQPGILHKEKHEVNVGARCTGSVTIGNKAVVQSRCGSSLKWTVTLRSKGRAPEILEHIAIGEDSVQVKIQDLEIGEYQILWRVKDACNNPQEEKSLITVVDDRAPSIFCKGSISVGLGSPNHPIGIWANDFVKSILDNCTNQENISLSFAPDEIVTSLDLTCAEYFGESILNIYATDEYGNQSYCEVKVKMSATDPECTRDVNVNGSLVDEFDRPVGNALLLLSDGQNTTEISTDDGGQFQIDQQFPLAAKPTISIGETVIDGRVTTVDLVAIQKHVVQFEKLEGMYDLSAADIDSDGTIGPNDVKLMRQYILGIKNLDEMMSNKLINLSDGSHGHSIALPSDGHIKLAVIANGDVTEISNN